MSGARDQVLGAVRRSLKRAPGDEAAIDARLAQHPRNLVPARGQLSPTERVDLFEAQAAAVQASVSRVGALAEVPEAVAGYLREQNLPGQLRVSPDPTVADLPWAEKAPLLTVSTGPARDADAVSVTPAFAGIAETGTLMLTSGKDRPATLNFLPETHIVVLKASQVVGAYEDAWDLLRQAEGEGVMPRSVNLITGPSRTGDIEQKIQLGAHGPRRLNIVVVEDGGA